MLPAKILLISADAEMSRTISTSLDQAGFKVIHTLRGLSGIDMFRIEKPSLIILDINLPDYNSLAIIRLMRAGELNPRTPIILFGATISEQDVLIGLEVGADLCLLEAFHPQVFVARVRSLLRRPSLRSPL